MGMPAFVNEWWFIYLVLPALIFCARIGDVSLDTIRIIYVNRGRKFVAPLLGVAQVLIWITAVSQVLNRQNPACVLGYAMGFGMGNFVGMIIEEKVAAGLLAVRIITAKDSEALVAALRGKGFGVTKLDGWGAEGPVNVIFVVIRRWHQATVAEMIRRITPGAFYSVEEVRAVSGGVYPADKGGGSMSLPALRWLRQDGR